MKKKNAQKTFVRVMALIMVAALAASVLLFARIDTRRESREKDLVE